MKKVGYWIRTFCATALCAALAAGYFSPQMQTIRSLPDAYYLQLGQNKVIEELSQNDITIRGESVEVRANGDQTLAEAKAARGIELDGVEQGNATITVHLFGLPVKQVSVNVVEERTVIPGGQSIGVALRTQGALVVGTSDILTADGQSVNPAQEAGISPGDVIRTVNGKEIQDAEDLSDAVNSLSGSVTLGVLKDGVLREVVVTPRADAQDGKLRLGLWVRDSTVGVGTLTFYDPQSNMFAALGHAITDIDTKARLSVSSGEIMQSRIIDIKQGLRGEPGELKGSFSSSETLGSIEKNTDFGIFGKAYNPIDNPLYPNGLSVATQDEVVLGPAEILSTIDESGVQSFSCEIVRTQTQSAPNQRGMVFQITDQRLIDTTGGIVQGMSGSPIIQNGKIIGCVTHVFINDPTRGYGMYIEWMLEKVQS